MLTRETIKAVGFRPTTQDRWFRRDLADGRVFEVVITGLVFNGDAEHDSDVELCKVANDAELIALCRAIPGWDNEKCDG
jgi:hypothetical protein